MAKELQQFNLYTPSSNGNREVFISTIHLQSRNDFLEVVSDPSYDRSIQCLYTFDEDHRDVDFMYNYAVLKSSMKFPPGKWGIVGSAQLGSIGYLVLLEVKEGDEA